MFYVGVQVRGFEKGPLHLFEDKVVMRNKTYARSRVPRVSMQGFFLQMGLEKRLQV